MEFFSIDGLSRKTISAIFILKILTGVILYLIYTYYYTDRRSADIFKYFDDGKIIFNTLFINPIHYLQIICGIDTDAEYLKQYLNKTDFWYKPHYTHVYNDNRTIIRFNAIAMIVSFGYYSVHSVFMNFISLIGLTAIFKTFRPYLANKKKELIAAVFLMPSVLFWGSGVLKEGMLFFGLGLLIFHFYNVCNNEITLKKIGWILLLTCLIAMAKFYILIAIAPALFTYFWVKKTNNRHVFLKYLGMYLLFFGIGLNIHWVSPENNALEMLVRKQTDFINLVDSLNSGSKFDINILEPTTLSFIKNVPQAMINTFIRPHIFEAKSPFILMAAVENLLIIVIAIISLIFIKFKGNDKNLIYFCAGFVLILFILTGIATPVMGAIVRYKVPALPFLLIAFLLMLDKEKMLKKIPFLNFLN